MDFDKLLQLMVQKNGSDLFITADVPPSMKVNGVIMPVAKNNLTPAQSMALVKSLMSPAQLKEFEETHECQFAINDKQKNARFRVSAFIQRDCAGMVLRKIETKIPKPEDLNLPPILKEIAMKKRGIVLLVGATGTGKSTTLAALIGHRNENSRGHIISIEDPIEYVHEHKGCIITQREVGIDTMSFEAGLKNTLRQAPDVILIGEIRTRETMDYAIQYAETGHLVFATLHANNANQAIDRIIHFFEGEHQGQILMDLSLNLRAIIAQQLLPTPDGKGRRAALEILLNTQLVGDYIRKGEIHEIKPLMKRSREVGMQTFDQALFDLYENGEITYQDAIKSADSPNDLRLLIKLQSKHSGKVDDNDSNFSLQADEDYSNKNVNLFR
ncbi:twitching motility protein [Moraxella macacae 0408225]|uniref:Twitching motility protein n=1 Tax=Moraxella macacae 0408225 TaxID=1230338 RepID=L2F6Y5_9GAMM|nr:PilT/PilU family type 4a pilus ATPase [Moraxella macacae]ELA08208.1 twitching motility protein [Moraxella macacae 0408225]